MHSHALSQTEGVVTDSHLVLSGALSVWVSNQ